MDLTCAREVYLSTDKTRPPRSRRCAVQHQHGLAPVLSILLNLYLVRPVEHGVQGSRWEAMWRYVACSSDYKLGTSFITHTPSFLTTRDHDSLQKHKYCTDGMHALSSTPNGGGVICKLLLIPPTPFSRHHEGFVPHTRLV